MSGRVSIKDVAEAAQVSIKTVSRVLNGVESVDPVMRDRVERAIASLDYVPNPTARSLRTGAGTVIGVVVDSIDDPFFAALVSAVEDDAQRQGLDVVVASTRYNPSRERVQLLRLVAQQARGIILAPTGQSLDFLAAHRSRTPVVTIDRAVPGFDSITVDDHAAAALAVEHLVAAGHRRIGFIGYDPVFQTARRRLRGYTDVLRRHELPVDVALRPEVALASDSARAALDAVLGLPDPPTALFLANARHATSAVAELHDLDRTDLAVVSFGDFTLADAVRPAISCVNQDPHRMGVVAFARLCELMLAPQTAPKAQRLQTSFIDRGSHTIAPLPPRRPRLRAGVATKDRRPRAGATAASNGAGR